MASTPITTAEFDSVLASSAKPVLVDFWASWCGPCRALGPVVEQISDEMADRLVVRKCNVDEEPDLATKFRIVSIPTLILFKGGQPVHTMVGNMPKADLVAELEAQL
jgi:thioredoxin 1